MARYLLLVQGEACIGFPWDTGLLKAVAAGVSRRLRRGDFVAPLGVGEFVVLLEAWRGRNPVERIAGGRVRQGGRQLPRVVPPERRCDARAPDSCMSPSKLRTKSAPQPAPY